MTDNDLTTVTGTYLPCPTCDAGIPLDATFPSDWTVTVANADGAVTITPHLPDCVVGAAQ